MAERRAACRRKGLPRVPAMADWRRAAAVAAAITASAAAIPEVATASAERGRSPTIRVSDNEYSKSKLTLDRGTKVDFEWDPGNSNPHTVTLRRGPNGVSKKRFRSKTGEPDVEFSPKFKTPGTYEFLCVIHPDEMQLKVEIRGK